MDVFGKNQLVDFDYFHFENMGFNYDLAKELAIILIDYADIDELKGIYNDAEKLYFYFITNNAEPRGINPDHYKNKGVVIDLSDEFLQWYRVGLEQLTDR